MKLVKRKEILGATRIGSSTLGNYVRVVTGYTPGANIMGLVAHPTRVLQILWPCAQLGVWRNIPRELRNKNIEHGLSAQLARSYHRGTTPPSPATASYSI